MTTTLRSIISRFVSATMFSASTLLITSTVVLAQGTTPDYTTVPVDPAETAQKLAAQKVDLAKAMEMAAQASGGGVVSASSKLNGDVAMYEVVCVSGGVAQTVMVNGQTGEVQAIRVTPPKALAAAQAKVNGVVRSVASNFSASPPTYTVEVLSGDKIHTIVIGAVDGAVVTENVRGRFPGVDATGEIVTTPSGLQYIELQPGTGAAPSGPGAVVEVHYTGYLVDGTKFDSSVDRGSPASFPLSNVIKGWTEGVGSMQVGSKRKLIIPFELAYGPGGRPPVIPAKATLIFDVELLKIVSDPATSGAAAGAPAGGAKTPPPVQPVQPTKPAGK